MSAPHAKHFGKPKAKRDAKRENKQPKPRARIPRFKPFTGVCSQDFLLAPALRLRSDFFGLRVEGKICRRDSR